MYSRDILPSFAGINTFARCPQSDIVDLKSGVVAVAGVAHDGTSSSRQGVRQGPRSIREASADFIFDVQGSSSQSVTNVLTGRVINLPREGSLVDLGNMPIYPMDLERTKASCRDAMNVMMSRGAFPVILGGDHYITYPLVQGFTNTVGKKVGMIQLSSQLDLGDKHAVWGRECEWVHGAADPGRGIGGWEEHRFPGNPGLHSGGRVGAGPKGGSYRHNGGLAKGTWRIRLGPGRRWRQQGMGATLST